MPNLELESKLFKKDANEYPIPVYIVPTMDERDEISFVDLWRVIVRRKAIILLSLLLSILLAIAYLFFAVPVYKADAYLFPPKGQEIQELLIDYRGVEGVDVNRYTPESVFGAFIDNLKSQGVRRKFFDSHELIKHYAGSESTKDINADRIFEGLFNERLKVQVDKKDTSFVTVNFSDSDAKLAAQKLNEIIRFQ